MTSSLRTLLRLSIPCAITAALLVCTLPARASTLESVRARDALLCGVVDEASGYSTRDAKGEWTGLAVEFCRALATAVLGRKDAAQFRPVTAGSRAAGLQDGLIDVLSTDTIVTSMRDTSAGIRFPGVLAYGGQGFMVRKAHGITSALELSGSRVCVSAHTEDEQGVLDYFAGLKIPVELVKLERWPEVVAAYDQKTCQVLSGSVAQLAAARTRLGNAAEHIVLPEMAARHAYGPAIRQGDEEWFSIVRWTLYALIAAEEMGVTSANAEQMRSVGSPEIKRLLSGGEQLCSHLGLAPDWPLRVIKQVGNYGEMYDRTLGSKSVLRLERARNNLAAKGGLHYAPSFR